jgi:hypothetical protein
VENPGIDAVRIQFNLFLRVRSAGSAVPLGAALTAPARFSVAAGAHLHRFQAAAYVTA